MTHYSIRNVLNHSVSFPKKYVGIFTLLFSFAVNCALYQIVGLCRFYHQERCYRY